MAADLGIGLGALGLLIGFPLLLLGVLWVLGWLESWMLFPDERAAAIHRLLEGSERAEDVEQAVTKLVAQVADARDERQSDPSSTATSSRSRQR